MIATLSIEYLTAVVRIRILIGTTVLRIRILIGKTVVPIRILIRKTVVPIVTPVVFRLFYDSNGTIDMVNVA